MIHYNKALLVLLTASAASNPVSASSPAAGVVDRVGIFKNVRTIMGTKNGNLRNLQGTLTTRCFTHCMEESLTPDECLAYIEEQVELAGGHEVGPITVKIQVPRPVESLADTYWMMEVPVNVNGQMTCDRDEGNTNTYPYVWQNGGAGVAVPTVACQGLSAGQCCVKIRELGQSLGKDENGNCLACFAHQEPLIPAIGAGSTVEYGDYEWDGSSCNALVLSPEQVGAADDATGVAVIAAAAVLKDFMENPDCADFSSLLTALYDAAVVIPTLPQYIGRLACDFCYDGAPFAIAPGFQELVDAILGELDPVPVFDSTENCIVIYTNAEGQIAEIPKLGGSRADDPYNDDCPPDLGGDGGVDPGAGAGEVPDDTDTIEGNGATDGTAGNGDATDGTDGNGDITDGTEGNGDATDGTEADTESDNETEPEVAPACYSPATPAPVNSLGTYIAPTGSCSPSSEDKSDLGLPYSITFSGSSVADDGSVTQFKYEVCTAQKDCGRRLKGGPQFRADAAISHFNIGIQGSCTITGFAMYDLDGVSQGGDFPTPAAYAIGMDPTTCIPGFKFDSGWDGVASIGCETGNWCRTIMVEVSGSVPVTKGLGVIKASTGFTEISDLSVPNCNSVCA